MKEAIGLGIAVIAAAPLVLMLYAAHWFYLWFKHSK